ncbi:MAG: SufS family cysteine desulfurase [Nanoarchaeota archaeon]
MKALVEISDFPILGRKIHGKRLVYLDNAATTQLPVQVISAIDTFYKKHNASINRGIYLLSQEATESYVQAKEKVAAFFHAIEHDVVFTKNATEALNIVSHACEGRLKKGDEILVSSVEHHANFVPWQVLAKKRSAKLVILPLSAENKIDHSLLKKFLSKKTRIVALSHMSNVLGIENPLADTIRLVKETDPSILTVIDACQSAAHIPIDVQGLGADFLALSSHKMLAPSGIGVLFGRKDIVVDFEPLLYGGDMIDKVTDAETTFAESPRRFEAGTQNPAGAHAFAEALSYLDKVGMDNVHAHCEQLGTLAYDLLVKIPGIEVYSPRIGNNGILSFNMRGVHPHDVASLLDSDGVAIRAGHHCAMPLMSRLGISFSCRASFYIYNTSDDAKALYTALMKVRDIFKKGDS